VQRMSNLANRAVAVFSDVIQDAGALVALVPLALMAA